MDTSLRPALRNPSRSRLVFFGVFLVLYALTLIIAERVVGRAGSETAFQKLYLAQGKQVDWLVLGASHALPLEYGDVPARVLRDSGQSMKVLAEIGAGPIYNRFIFEQALHDLDVKNLIYVVDSFAFSSKEWNESRLTDRTLLRHTPLRLSTVRILTNLSLRFRVDPRGLLDYLTGFSKLNSVNRFSLDGWQGAANFDHSFRLSRYAVSSRISYLYPDNPPESDTVSRYLDAFDGLLKLANAEGIDVIVVKLPIPSVFRNSLPDEMAFDAALQNRLSVHDIVLQDLSATLPDLNFYFDTDHLNMAGVDALYQNDFISLLMAQ